MKRKTEGQGPSKREVGKICKALEATHIPLVSIMNLGRSFDYSNQGELTGYTLSDAVGAISREIIAKLGATGLLDHDDSKAGEHAQNADYILTDLSLILTELSNDSDDWGGSMTSAVGRMVAVMAHEAAREVERAEIALNGGNGSVMGFLDKAFDPLKA